MEWKRRFFCGLIALSAIVATIAVVAWWVGPSAHESAPVRGTASAEPSAAAPSASADSRPVVATPGAVKPFIPLMPAAEQKRALEKFTAWTTLYSTAVSADRPALLARGLALARTRRPLMAHLISTDPQEALRQAVTLDVWADLPPELQAEVEEPFSAVGNVRVLPACVIGSPEYAARAARGERFPEATRLVEVAGRAVAQSFVYGRREPLGTKENTPVQGIRLGPQAALHEDVLRLLTPRERTVAGALFPAANPVPGLAFGTGRPLGADAVAAVGGGRVYSFESLAALADFNARLGKLDELPGPHAGSSVLFLPAPVPGAAPTAAFNFEAAAATANRLATTWAETPKKVFFIRIDFSDKPNATFPVVDGPAYAATLNGPVSTAIRDFSYGKTSIDAAVSADITRVPRTSSYYAQQVTAGNSRNTELLADARTAYKAAHPTFNMADYDITGVWFVSNNMLGSGVKYAGLAGGSDIWIQGNTGADVLVHEFGHNFGVGHSSFWVRSGASTNPVDPAGSSEEYGDPFDVMGDGTLPNGVFHPEAKQRLGWLGANEWAPAVNASTTFRIGQIDHPGTTGLRGVRVAKGSTDFYWIGYRRLYNNPALRAGAYLVWQRTAQGRSWFIDTTPNTLAGTDDRRDGPVTIGRTYADTAANVFITPLARGGTGAAEYLDVRVNRGTYPGNQAPTLTLSGPTSASARSTVTFTAQAADANGDELAYAWDFGTGTEFDNHPVAAFSWAVGGMYTVKLVVSDMKGLSATATKTVTVSDPLLTWSMRTNPGPGTLEAIASNGAQVLAVGSDFDDFEGSAIVSNDGISWTSPSTNGLGFPREGHGVVWDGISWIVAGSEYDFDAEAFKGAIFTSTNAATWTRRFFSGADLRAVATSGAVSVAVGDGGVIIRSTNAGVTWTPATSGTSSNLAGIAFTGTRFVAVGYAGTNGNCTIIHSMDGLTWTNASAGAGTESYADFRTIRQLGLSLVASGFYGRVSTSLDGGATFSSNRTHFENTPATAYGNGVWFAAGIDYDTSDAAINLVSLDSLNWQALPAPGSVPERKAAIFFKNTFITVGETHSIRQSNPFLAGGAGYRGWRDGHFPNHDAFSAPAADPEADGLTNVLEYSLGLDPLDGFGVNGTAALPQAVSLAEIPTLADRLALQLSMPEPAATDITYIVQATPSLSAPAWTAIATKVGAGAWTWNGGGTPRILLGPVSGGRQSAAIGDSQPKAGNATRFLRLQTYFSP